MIRTSPRQYALALATLLHDTPVAHQPKAIRAFLRLLQKRRHLKHLPRIVVAFETERDRSTKTVRVTARAARPLPVTFEDRLKAKLGGTIVVSHETDPALKGGLQLQVGQTLIDGTVGSLIADLRHAFMSDSLSV